MSKKKNLKERASNPKFSLETREGQTYARYSVDIDGLDHSVEYATTKGEAAAIKGGRDRFDEMLSRTYDEVFFNGFEAVLGAPEREPAMAWHSRQSDQSDPTTAGTDIDPLTGRPFEETGESPKVNPSQLGTLGTPNDANVEPPPPGEMTKGDPKNHVPWSSSFFLAGAQLDGVGDTELEEPNPEYFNRPGDEIIKGKNNTMIILGRDRAPEDTEVFSKNIQSRHYNSGYSDHMGAGAIDIVVGRGAPFPLESIGPVGNIVLGPCYNTSWPAEIQGLQLEGGEHPGMMMDAARIYVSQMTNIDENFKINKNIYSEPGSNSSDVTNTGAVSVYPTSAIMLKADKIRLHSRQDIKIVTGGSSEAYNSQGNKIKHNNGIHLMAENGELARQQPIPLGENVEDAFSALIDIVDELVGALDAMTGAQMMFNQIVANHFHLVAPSPAATMPDPFSQLQGVITNLMHIYHTRLGCFYQKVNIFGFKATYLNIANSKYINSLHNTVN